MNVPYLTKLIWQASFTTYNQKWHMTRMEKFTKDKIGRKKIKTIHATIPKKNKIKSKIKNQNTEIHGRACFNAKENLSCVQKWKFQDICKWWWIRLNSVVSIDLKTMAQTYLCSVCHSPLNIDNTVAWCEKLSNASSQSQIQMQR